MSKPLPDFSWPKRSGYWSNGVESEKSAVFPELVAPEVVRPRRKLRRFWVVAMILFCFFIVRWL